ncbi:hypothetical protein I6F11_17380 [Ensifer sp. NBAIM29]|nr:hypothetical protein [Ensifer sp. NBAIM29]
MGVFFEPFSVDRCCLCGSAEELTGEHKIKASALRSIFRKERMVIGHFDGKSEPRLAQGPKSSEFHFSARLCGTCNSARTQAADREFDRFHSEALSLLTAGDAPGRVFELDRYRIGTEPYLNIFRYFAKLMACHIADFEGPRAIQIGDFATGKAAFNPIKLYLDADPTYSEFSSVLGEHSYAAHGGLVVKFSRTSELPTGFHSTLSLGPLRYVFFVNFGFMIALSLKMFHREFFAKCHASFRRALEDPMLNHELRQLGLIRPGDR